MTEAAPVAGNPAPANPPAPAVAPPAPAPEPADNNNPKWLSERLARHEQHILKELGFATKEEAAAAKKAADEIAQAKKTQEERLAEANTSLAAERARIAEYEKTITARAAREMSTLSAERQAAVKALAGDDAAKQLNVIDALSATWGVAPVVPAPVAPPANTAPSAGGPPPPPANPQPNVLATYEALRESNPVKAASYYLQNQAAITAARKT